MGLRYKLCYKKGTGNRAADALSRISPQSELQVFHLSVTQPLWLEEIGQSYHKFEETAKLRGRILVPPDPEMQKKIVNALHASPIGGHSGYHVTYQKVKSLFVWTRMKQMIQDIVAQCQICQMAKAERVKYPGLLQPLPIPQFAWQVVTMDFIEGVPKSHSYNCIMVVVDKFSKYAHFVLLSHPFTALKVALSYMDNVYKLHGLPEAIVSDRDKIFTSALWQELFRLAGTQLKMSTSYHPQTDGQTERVNQCLEAYLRCFVHACPQKWKDWLALAEFWYNTSYHSSLEKTPFEILYGQQPRHLGTDVVESCAIPDLNTLLAERKIMVQLLQQQLTRVQQSQKHQADKNMTERSFEVGELVF